MEKKLTRRESRETAFLTAFAATFEPEEPTVPAEEHAAPDAFANQLLAAATLWAVSIYLRSKNRCCWPAAAPAAFLSLVVFQYLFSSSEMCGFSEEASLIASVLLTAVIGVLCLFRGSGLEKAEEPSL